MKALVTGSTGFLGKRLAERLYGLGWDVTAVGRNEQAGIALSGAGIRFVKLDLRDREGVHRVVAGQDVVFHCAALSSAWGRYRDFYESNVTATEFLLDAARAHSVRRFVHVSTPSVYFNYTDQFNLTEDSELPSRFANDYTRTKYEAECRVRKAFAAGLPSLIIRPRAIFGPGDPALFPRLMRANDKFGIPLIDGGRALIDLTYVDNVVDALLCCSQASESALGETYNISNGEPVRFVDAVNRLFGKLGVTPRYRHLAYPTADRLAAGLETVYRLLRLRGEPPFTRYTIGVVSRSQTLDIGKAGRLLGYKPNVSVDEGLARFADWWREHHK
jgi:nucleoside-diphosphate-sugar epimerase